MRNSVYRTIAMIPKIFFRLIFATNFIFYGYASYANSSPNSQPPINQLADIIRFFNTTELCDHNCDASTWFDDYGSLNICFTTKMIEGESSGMKKRKSFNFLMKTQLLIR